MSEPTTEDLRKWLYAHYQANDCAGMHPELLHAGDRLKELEELSPLAKRIAEADPSARLEVTMWFDSVEKWILWGLEHGADKHGAASMRGKLKLMKLAALAGVTK